MPEPPPRLRESFGGYVPHGCWGSVIQLAMIEACRCELRDRSLGPGMASPRTSCSEGFYESDLRHRLGVRLLARPSEVRSTETIRLVVELTNLTEDPLGLIFRRRPSYHPQLYSHMVRVFDAGGNDRSVDGIVQTTSGAHGDYLVVLAPRGKGYFSLGWQAVTIVGQSAPEGARFEAVPLPAGSYRLAFRLHFDDSLQLTEQQRLPSAPITVTAAPPPGAASESAPERSHGLE